MATPREVLDFPDPEGPSIATTTPTTACLSNRFLDRCSLPVGGPAPLPERAQQVVHRLGAHRQLDDAVLAPGVVVDPEVLDVNVDLAGVREQPGQLPRMVRYGDEDRLDRAGRPPVLARDDGGALHPAVQ